MIVYHVHESVHVVNPIVEFLLVGLAILQTTPRFPTPRQPWIYVGI